MSYELLICSGDSNPALTQSIADTLGVRLGDLSLGRFSDNELSIKINENVRGRDVFLVQSLSNPANDYLMQTFLLLDALRRASAARITVVIPYYGYGRQDRKSEPRVPISARVVADLLETMLIDRVVALDLHADQIQGFFHVPVDHLYAAPVFVSYLKSKGLYGDKVIVVSPDSGGVERSRFLARQLGSSLAIIDKRRPRANVAEVMNVIGDVEGKTCILYDDMIDTGGTIASAAAALKKNKAANIKACATHAVLSGKAPSRLQDSCMDEIILTDSIRLPKENLMDKFTILSVAPLMSEAIRRIHNEESVSSLFL